MKSAAQWAKVYILGRRSYTIEKLIRCAINERLDEVIEAVKQYTDCFNEEKLKALIADVEKLKEPI